MKAYSDDLRIRIVKAYLNGISIGQISDQYFVSKSFVSRLIGHYYKTGRVTPGSKLKCYPVPVCDTRW